MLNLSSKVRLMCCLTSHLSACSKLFDLNTTRSMRQFYYLKIAVSRSKSLVGSTKSKGARGRGKKRFLDTDYADVRGFWLGQLQIPSFKSSTGGVQFVF